MCRARAARDVLGPVLGSTGLSTPCERGCRLVETACQDAHERPAMTGSVQVRGHFMACWRMRRRHCGEGPRRTRGNSTRFEHNAAGSAPARRSPQVLEPLRGGWIRSMVPGPFPHPSARRAPADRPQCRASPGGAGGLFDLMIRARVPFLGHPVSTGCRMSMSFHQSGRLRSGGGVLWAGGAWPKPQDLCT